MTSSARWLLLFRTATLALRRPGLPGRLAADLGGSQRPRRFATGESGGK